MTLLTPLQAAARLGVDTRTVHRWIRSGRLRAVRVAGAWRIAETDLAPAKTGLVAGGPLAVSDDQSTPVVTIDTYLIWTRKISEVAAGEALNGEAARRVGEAAERLRDALEAWAASTGGRSGRLD